MADTFNVALLGLGALGVRTTSHTVTVKLWTEDGFKGYVEMSYSADPNPGDPTPTLTPESHLVHLDPDNNAGNPLTRQVVIETATSNDGGTFVVEANGGAYYATDNGTYPP